MHVLVLGGVEESYHQFEEVVPPLADLVASLGHRGTPARPHQVLDPASLAKFDVIVSATTSGELGETQQRALFEALGTPRNYRNRPVQFLGLHGAACSFRNSPEYAHMLGGRFVDHPAMAPVQVTRALHHPVTRDVDQFVIFEELYALEITRPVRVLLKGKLVSQGGADYRPLGWTHRHGAGHVVYLALGHGTDQLEHPKLQQLIANTLGWFAEVG